MVAWHRFGPYHCARLKAAARRLDLLGLEISTVDKVNAWAPVAGADGFARRTLLTGHDADALSPAELAALIDAALAPERPAVIAVHGWADRGALVLLRWARLHGVPTVMMSESTAIDSPRVPYKELFKRRLLRSCAAAIVGGTPQADYLARLGVPRSRIALGYDVVDNGHFAAGADAARRQAAAERARLGLPERFFLASSRFVPQKNLFRLLDAYDLYRGTAGPGAWPLVLLGDGELRDAVLARRAALGLEAHVLLPGFRQHDELPAWYGLASAFVLASTTEQWGLVVNEAMAAGLPVLVSDRCGCATDLVKSGVNGFTFEPTDVRGLAARLRLLAHGGLDLEAMGQASRAIVAAWGPERFAAGLAQAVGTALAAPAAPPSYLDRRLLDGLVRRCG